MENYMGMEIDMLNEKLKEKDERIKELEGMIVGYREMVSNNGAHITRLDNEKRELAEEVNKQAEELEILQNDNNKLCEHIEELNRNLDSANRENDELRRELNKKANRLHDEIANKDNRIEALVKENDILSKTVGELEREIRKKANNIERLDRALEIYCNRVHELSVGNDNLRKDNKELVERIEKLEQEKERTVVPSKLIDELQAAREKVEELEKQIKERDEWIENLKIENLKEENEALKKKLEDKNKLIDYMRYKNDRFEEQVDKLNRDASERDETIKNLNEELATKTMKVVAARISSGTRTGMMYIDSTIRDRAVDEAFKAMDEAIKKLDEEAVLKVNKEI